MRVHGLYLALSLSLFVLSAHDGRAGVRREDVDDSEFLALATSALYESVGRINYSVGSSSFIASGVLISPDWVLTAAHVTGGDNFLGQGISNMTFSLTTGSGVLSYAAAEWRTHPGWAVSSGNLWGGVRYRSGPAQ